MIRPRSFILAMVLLCTPSFHPASHTHTAIPGAHSAQASPTTITTAITQPQPLMGEGS